MQMPRLMTTIHEGRLFFTVNSTTGNSSVVGGDMFSALIVVIRRFREKSILAANKHFSSIRT